MQLRDIGVDPPRRAGPSTRLHHPLTNYFRKKAIGVTHGGRKLVPKAHDNELTAG